MNFPVSTNNTNKTFFSPEYGKARKRIDVSKLMPQRWDIPDEFFAVNMPVSNNPTINYCDAIVRKAKLVKENFLGKEEPAYVKKGRRTQSMDEIEESQCEIHESRDSGRGVERRNSLVVKVARKKFNWMKRKNTEKKCKNLPIKKTPTIQKSRNSGIILSPVPSSTAHNDLKSSTHHSFHRKIPIRKVNPEGEKILEESRNRRRK